MESTKVLKDIGSFPIKEQKIFNEDGTEYDSPGYKLGTCDIGCGRPFLQGMNRSETSCGRPACDARQEESIPRVSEGWENREPK